MVGEYPTAPTCRPGSTCLDGTTDAGEKTMLAQQSAPRTVAKDDPAPTTHAGEINRKQSALAQAGDQLRRVRLEHGWTQRTLAEATGVSRSLVAQWETGRTGYGGKLRAIATALDVPVREFLTRGLAHGKQDATDEAVLLRLFAVLPSEDRANLLHLCERMAAPASDPHAVDPPTAST